MTTQPELPDIAPLPARPILYVAPAPAESDVDFDGFVRAYEARLRRLVMRRIGDLCEAEEITQETLLRAYQHRASFATEDELMAWSTVVAQRLVIDRVRVRGRSIAVSEVPESARLGRDTADIVVARHEARAALESLEAIPTRQAAILWAREVEGLHYEEIAERFGITEPAVRSLLHRGRKALRKEFKDRTGSLPLNGLVPFAPWLLALKAAGKVRGAAKTIARSSVTGAAALSLSALVAVTGIGPFGAGTDHAPAMQADAGRGGATYVNSAEAVPPAQRVTALSRTVRRVTPTDTAAPSDQKAGGGTKAGVCTPIKCANYDDETPGRPGAYIQIGPDLPEDNPLDLENVIVASNYVDCDDLDIPETVVAKCTGPSKQDDQQQSPSAPSALEGAVR